MLSADCDSKLEEDLSLGPAVTPKYARTAPIHNWFLYPHSFSPQLVYWLLEKLAVPEGGLVYDPFAGAGTTLLACKERSVSAVGADTLPLSVFVSNVKVRDYEVGALREDLAALSPACQKDSPSRFADIPVLERAFDEESIKRISGVYDAIQGVEHQVHRDFFLLGLLSILTQVSRAARDGGWLRILDSSEYGADDLIDLFLGKTQEMLSQLDMAPCRPADGLSWQAYLADARSEEPPVQADAVISSPPYPNRHDYTRVFGIELALGFVEDQEALKRLRYESLRSHVEARPPATDRCQGFCQPDVLRTTMKELARSCEDRRVTRMVSGYFEDIYAVLRALVAKVKRGGSVAFVVGNTRHAGVLVPVDIIVAALGESVGLKLEGITAVRYRGNSAQQMGRHGRVPARESVIVWKRCLAT
jgi:hypothetical protein